MDTTIESKKVTHAPSADLISILERHQDELNLRQAVLHYDFPIYKDEEGHAVSVRVLLLSQHHGAIVFGTSSARNSKTDSDDLEDANRQLEHAASLLYGRLLKNKALRKAGMQLSLPVNVVLHTPFLNDKVKLDTAVTSNDKSVLKLLQKLTIPEIEPDLFNELVSSAEGAKGLIRPRKRIISEEEPNSKGNQAALLEAEICRFDKNQKYSSAPIFDGPQRIRGLAGSGKTVVLAMKAAQMHLREPDATIVYTFYTKSLYQYIKRLITRFYRQFDDRDPDWNRLRVMHGWGGKSNAGVYYDACQSHNRAPLTFSDAIAAKATSPFDHVCTRLLEATTIKPIYDYVLVDEGQDFPTSFIRLCSSLAKNGRVVWAYDDFQTIWQVQSPTPKEIFGVDAKGNSKVELTDDIVLYKCYRNPREILVCAHALGLGIYGKHIVQLLENEEHWHDIGYQVHSGKFKQGEDIVIERPEENSLRTISDVSGIDEIVQLRIFHTMDEEIAAVAASIKKDIRDGLRPDDILVIAVDDRNAKIFLSAAGSALRSAGIRSNNVHFDAFGVHDFLEDDHVTLSTVHKAKGNEAFMVYILGVEALFRPATVRTRNMLFTAMTRAKGWVRLSGTGVFADLCRLELEQAKKNFPRLLFAYPSPEEIKIMKRGLEEGAIRKQAAERMLDEVLIDMSDDEVEDYLRKRRNLDPGGTRPSEGKRKPK